MPREVDGKDASRIREVARIDPAMVRLNRGSAEGETESQTCSIGAALLERTEQFVGVAARNPVAGASCSGAAARTSVSQRVNNVVDTHANTQR